MRVETLLAQEAREENKIILSYVLGVSFGTLRAMLQTELTDAEAKEFTRIRGARDAGMPLQYAIGEWNFYGRDFLTDERALIPRPETELLVERVLQEIDEREAQNAESVQKPIRILDIGTGTGIIPLTIALERREAIDLYASDISALALSLAKENALRFGVTTVTWLHGDLFDVDIELPNGDIELPNSDVELPNRDLALPTLDLIVSNPPYVEETVKETLQSELLYEPQNALYAGADGLDFYRRLIPEAREHLRKGGKLFLEIGAKQGEEIRSMLTQMGYEEIGIHKDYAECDRIVIATWIGRK